MYFFKNILIKILNIIKFIIKIGIKKKGNIMKLIINKKIKFFFYLFFLYFKIGLYKK